MSLAGSVRAIRRKSLHEELAEKLGEMIVNGELAPGTKIPERQLCEVFEVSRTPMREALKVLAAEGLVTLATNRGAWVSEITVDELEEVFPVMGALEALSGELACAAISDADIAGIEALHVRMRDQYEARDLAGYFRTNQKIHDAILTAARNDTLSAQHRALAVKVRRARYVANMTDPRWAQAMAEHEEILAALKARDGQALAKVLRRHLQNKLQTVRDWLVEQDRSAG